MKYLAWLDYEINVNHRSDITEYTGAGKLESLLKAGENFYSLSFPTISAFSTNTGIGHYKFTLEKAANITAYGIYLLNCGAHYLYQTLLHPKLNWFEQKMVGMGQR